MCAVNITTAYAEMRDMARNRKTNVDVRNQFSYSICVLIFRAEVCDWWERGCCVIKNHDSLTGATVLRTAVTGTDYKHIIKITAFQSTLSVGRNPQRQLFLYSIRGEIDRKKGVSTLDSNNAINDLGALKEAGRIIAVPERVSECVCVCVCVIIHLCKGRDWISWDLRYTLLHRHAHLFE